MYSREIKKTSVHTKTYMWVFVAALLIIAQKQKQTKCLSLGEEINKSVIWYGILLSNKKELTTGICYNMDMPQKEYHRKKPDVKEHKLHDFINRRSPEKTNL